MNIDSIILASKSPRRKELLEKLRLGRFKVIEADIDETLPAGMDCGDAVAAIALKKARAVWERVDHEGVIIAADTMVVFDGNRLGKPQDEADAFAMLNLLSGMWHEVITGVAVIRDGKELTAHESTRVKFRELSTEDIEGYIASEEPMDKAGAYGAQGLGSLFVERIEGDFFNVMGLPLYRLGKMLREIGIDPLAED